MIGGGVAAEACAALSTSVSSMVNAGCECDGGDIVT